MTPEIRWQIFWSSLVRLVPVMASAYNKSSGLLGRPGWGEQERHPPDGKTIFWGLVKSANSYSEPINYTMKNIKNTKSTNITSSLKTRKGRTVLIDNRENQLSAILLAFKSYNIPLPRNWESLDLTDQTGNFINLQNLIKYLLIFDENNRCTNAFAIASNKYTLLKAYELLKSNPGNMVPAADKEKETFDGINAEWFDKTSEELKTWNFEFKPARRVFIPKPNGKLRPLGISSPRDKIVQQALKMVLEVVLEPKFLDSSHGFRPKRGCHTALQTFRSWSGLPWAIEGDIQGFFDNIDHNILASKMNEHFAEVGLTKIYWSLVKAGYLEYDTAKKKFSHSDPLGVGVPQGGIVSPLLSNLYLHDLDKFMGDKQEAIDIANKSKKNTKSSPIYWRLVKRITKIRKEIVNAVFPQRELLRKRLKQLISKRSRYKSLIPTLRLEKIRYVRYADDWVVGVWGTYEEAAKLRQEINEFLTSMKLTLSLEKTKITNLTQEDAVFLSTRNGRFNIGQEAKVISYNSKDQSILRRLSTGKLALRVPTDKIAKRLEAKKMIRFAKHGIRGRGLTQLIPLNLPELLVRYKAIYNGIENYYSFADNIKALRGIYWMLKISLLATIARKLNISTSKVLKKLGKDITVRKRMGPSTSEQKPGSVISFSAPKLIKNVMNFQNNTGLDPFNVLNWKVWSRSRFSLPCAYCQSQDQVEMHHIKHIKKINVKLSSFDLMIARLNRKQVPLCKTCHVKVHSGLYAGPSLKQLTSKDIEGRHLNRIRSYYKSS